MQLNTNHISFIKRHKLNHEVLTRIRAMRNLTSIGAITALALIEPDVLESNGVYVNFESRCNDGEIVRVYIGLAATGIIANYCAANDEWHTCQSHGNFGKNPASGGTWSSIAKRKSVPEIVAKLIKAL